MKTILTTATALLLVAACTPAPQVCERTVGMSKEGIPIMLGEPCVIAPTWTPPLAVDWPHDDDRTERPVDASPPTTPEEPTTPPVEPPSEPVTPPVTEPPVVEPPVTEPPVTEPPSDDDDGPKDDREKTDNSDANGKGGNGHDRDDKDKPSQEIAEDKKDD